MSYEEKSHVGMGLHVCPVCLKEHDEVVLLDRRLKKSLTRREFAGWELCEEHNKLYTDGYIALVECTNQPKDLQSANRTGNIAHIRQSAWSQVFDIPIPDTAMAFVEIGVVDWLREMTEKETEQHD